MITIFNSRTVYLGNDMKRFGEIRDCLDAAGIQYKYKVKNRMSDWSDRTTLRGRLGSAGNPAELAYMYEILVHKNDYERALRTIR
ncbi:hypothetical protein AALB64_02785 [Lachnospiraceae bacterium 45-P1]